MEDKQCVHFIWLPKNESCSDLTVGVIRMLHMRCLYVNRMSPVVILRNILFAKVTRSHFVNTVKPRDYTQLADWYCLCEIRPISLWHRILYTLLWSNAWIFQPHKFQFTNFQLTPTSENIFKVVLLYLLFVSLFFTQQLPLLCKLPMSCLSCRAFRPFLNYPHLSSLHLQHHLFPHCHRTGNKPVYLWSKK